MEMAAWRDGEEPGGLPKTVFASSKERLIHISQTSTLFSCAVAKEEDEVKDDKTHKKAKKVPQMLSLYSLAKQLVPLQQSKNFLKFKP